mgnify:CR=1 FL=1
MMDPNDVNNIGKHGDQGLAATTIPACRLVLANEAARMELRELVPNLFSVCMDDVLEKDSRIPDWYWDKRDNTRPKHGEDPIQVQHLSKFPDPLFARCGTVEGLVCKHVCHPDGTMRDFASENLLDAWGGQSQIPSSQQQASQCTSTSVGLFYEPKDPASVIPANTILCQYGGFIVKKKFANHLFELNEATHVNTVVKGDGWCVDGNTRGDMTARWLCKRGSPGPLINSPVLSESSHHATRHANCRYRVIEGSKKRPREEEGAEGGSDFGLDWDPTEEEKKAWGCWDPRWTMTPGMEQAGFGKVGSVGGEEALSVAEVTGGYRLFVESTVPIAAGEQLLAEFNSSYFRDGDFRDKMLTVRTLAAAMTDVLKAQIRHLITSGCDCESLQKQRTEQLQHAGIHPHLLATPESRRFVQEWWEDGAVIRVVCMEHLLGIIDGSKPAEGASNLSHEHRFDGANWPEGGIWLGIQVSASTGKQPERWNLHPKDKDTYGCLVLLIKVDRITRITPDAVEGEHVDNARVRRGLMRLTARGGTGDKTLEFPHHLVFSRNCDGTNKVVRLLQPVKVTEDDVHSQQKLGFYTVKHVEDFNKRVLAALEPPV